MVTPYMREAMYRYIDKNCQYTLGAIQHLIKIDFDGVHISLQTISRHLLGILYSIFAEKLIQHQHAGDYIVYFDETNYNMYCHRSVGHANKGDHAATVLLPSNGSNLQVQCAVSAEEGLVFHRLERDSIKMEKYATFVDEVYNAVKRSATWCNNFVGKNVVIVFDNAPAHSQTEERVVMHDDLVLLRLGPYSPMLNPIESCFSVFKAKIKNYLADLTDLMFQRREYPSYLESRMRLLKAAAHECLPCITRSLVVREAMFCQRNVEKALRLEDMCYGK
ncbi:hypothetical protein DYB32_006568 [Aphanomyces invadans]|uniref:Tc1-like transposase DDE domain-containing protein n=1 Tax=Aphanomyces invadans TaxID=157072 RepID=A0A418ARF0_9STRA|nr:hypothetical protein DYB32_006568 [Aphanomyces invadans]